MSSGLVNSSREGKKNGNFLCGVVEGFYGRPWTSEQRKDLFKKQKKWGLNCYVYAPKDDYKHRAYWRELYTVEEADHLANLITAAKNEGILFFYALSPGLDITYSSAKEISTLKRKLEQVSQFGCEAFALLFDDIDSELSKSDKDAFQTFANAQVSVTNEIFNYLNGPRFLFCPTQYCNSRAIPSVTHSEYLNTLGLKLCPEIDILWTGPKVISKTLTVDSIQEILEVLRRPPVIWDNLHANDYDQRRLFLGPYSGRSTELIPLLRGVLTNPNCEFHGNTVAIYTLAYWSKCLSDKIITISADVKLETEGDDSGRDEDALLFPKDIYHPRIALKQALIEWLQDFSVERKTSGSMLKPQPSIAIMPIIPIMPSINTCMSLTTTTTTNSTTSFLKIPEVSTNQLQTLAKVCSTISNEDTTSIPNVIMNSLASATKVVTDTSLPNPIVKSVSNMKIPNNIPISSIAVPIMNVVYDGKATYMEQSDLLDGAILSDHVSTEELQTEKGKNSILPVKVAEPKGAYSVESDGTKENLSLYTPVEAMECGSIQFAAKPAAKYCYTDTIMSETRSVSSINSEEKRVNLSLKINDEKIVSEDITVDDLLLLCDLFYLPFEHGNRGLRLLNDFNWLKTNAHALLHSEGKGTNLKPEAQEWIHQAEKFSELCQSIFKLHRKIARCINRELIFDLYSYIWDITGVISILDAFVKWLALGTFSTNINRFVQSSYTWFNGGWKEAFMSGEQEPWYFRGGLASDLQRLIPIDNGNDLFIYKLPSTPNPNFCKMRPYSPLDEKLIYQIYSEFHRHIIDSEDNLPDYLQSLFADRFVGHFLTLQPECCLVIENVEGEIEGFACAAVDFNIFRRNQEIAWIPAMCEKYPLSLTNAKDLPSNIRDIIFYFHYYKNITPSEVIKNHPSILTVYLKNEHQYDPSISKRLITVLLAVLRSNGSFGVHVCIDSSDNNLLQFYSKLGFVELYKDSVNLHVFLGRKF